MKLSLVLCLACVATGLGSYISRRGRGKTQCCQLWAKLSGQSGGRIRSLRKKSGPLLNLTFWRRLSWWMMKILLSVSTCLGKYNISVICTELERVRGEKLIFKKFGSFQPFLYLIVPKFGRSFVRPLYFLFGLFWVMRPNNRPVGKTHQTRKDFDPKLIHGGAIGCDPLISCVLEKVLIVSVEGGLIVICRSSTEMEFLNGNFYRGFWA